MRNNSGETVITQQEAEAYEYFNVVSFQQLVLTILRGRGAPVLALIDGDNITFGTSMDFQFALEQRFDNTMHIQWHRNPNGSNKRNSNWALFFRRVVVSHLS